jgi:hypothetical protein
MRAESAAGIVFATCEIWFSSVSARVTSAESTVGVPASAVAGGFGAFWPGWVLPSGIAAVTPRIGSDIGFL